MRSLPFIGEVKDIAEYLVKMNEQGIGVLAADVQVKRTKVFYTKKARSCKNCEFAGYGGRCDWEVATEKYREFIDPLDHPYRPTQVCIPIKGRTDSQMYYANYLEHTLMPRLREKIKNWNDYLSE